MKLSKLFSILCLLGILTLVGCNPEKDNDPFASIYQTQWKGTLTVDGDQIEISTIAFPQKEIGVCVYKNQLDVETYTTFQYVKNDKVIRISNSDIIGGQWWIYKLTPSEMVLKATPYYNERVLTLERTY